MSGAELWSMEQELIAQGRGPICGVDEAGTYCGGATTRGTGA